MSPLDAVRELLLTLALKVLVDLNQHILGGARRAVVHQVVSIHDEPVSEIFVDLISQKRVLCRTFFMVTHAEAPADPGNQFLVGFLHISYEKQSFHFLFMGVEGVLLIVIFR